MIMSKKVMKLLDPSTGFMECKICGSVHFASLKSGGFYQRGSWQCMNGCKMDDKEQAVNSKS